MKKIIKLVKGLSLIILIWSILFGFLCILYGFEFMKCDKIYDIAGISFVYSYLIGSWFGHKIESKFFNN